MSKFVGHHYVIWASDSNFLLAQKKISGQPKKRLALISGTYYHLQFFFYFGMLNWGNYCKKFRDISCYRELNATGVSIEILT